MNLNITVQDDVRQDVKDNVGDWFNEVGEWSQQRYEAVDLEAGTVISVESHEWFNGIAYKPQRRPFEIRISDLCDYVHWSVEMMDKYHFKPTGHYYVGNEIGMKAAMVAAFNAVQYTQGESDIRECWNADVDPAEAKLAWLKETHPELVDSWWSQKKYEESIKVKPEPEHWRFPAINPKLCRSGSWGPGAVFPESSGRK